MRTLCSVPLVSGLERFHCITYTVSIRGSIFNVYTCSDSNPFQKRTINYILYTHAVCYSDIFGHEICEQFLVCAHLILTEHLKEVTSISYLLR